MWYDSFDLFFKNLGKTFKLQKEILKTEINYDEVYSETWRDKKSERLDYVKNDVLCTVFHRLGILKLWEKSLVLE